MMHPRGAPLPTVHVNWITITGGVGDHIGRMPPVRYVIENYPHVSIHLTVPDYFYEFAEHIFKDVKHRVFVKPLARVLDRPESFNPNLPGKTFDDQVHSALHSHTTDHAFRIYADVDDYPRGARNYPRVRLDEIDVSRFALPKLYVVLATGYTAKVKEWPSAEINKVARWLVARGITPVFLGKAQTPHFDGTQITASFDTGVDYSLGLNLVDQTSLLEATAIMGKALAVCGMDGALIHYAAATDVPIVAGYTFVDPKHRLPIRYGKTGGGCHVVTPPASLGCRFCQEKYHFVYNHLFTECYHGDFKCVSYMRGEAFIKKLEVIVGAPTR